MPWTYSADGCRKWITDQTLEAWRSWRIGHPSWQQPIQNVISAARICGKPAALAGLLAALPTPSLLPPGGSDGGAVPPAVYAPPPYPTGSDLYPPGYGVGPGSGGAFGPASGVGPSSFPAPFGGAVPSSPAPVLSDLPPSGVLPFPLAPPVPFQTAPPGTFRTAPPGPLPPAAPDIVPPTPQFLTPGFELPALIPASPLPSAPVAVVEPSTLTLMGLSVAALLFFQRRTSRRRK